VRGWAILASTIALSANVARLRTDPAEDLARVRLIVSTTAEIADVTVDGATIASYVSALLDGADGSGASETGFTMRTRNAAPGQRAEAQFDIILQGVTPGRTLTWNLATSIATDAQVEVYSLTVLDRPRLVDRFESHGIEAHFTSATSLLAANGTVSVSPLMPHMVLAQYYPWYSRDTWSDPQLADQPLHLYSSDAPADIDAQARQAQSAGIDAFVVSWQGRSNESNDRRMRMVLDASRAANMRACLYVETFIVNRTNDSSLPTDPDVMVEWLEDAVDLYASHPAYLRVEGRPVILVYAASRLPESAWRDALARVRASGRNPIVVGDFYHSRLINVLEGEYQYLNVTLSSDALLELDRTESLRVRTFNLLRPDDRRRIWVASVSPGVDDRRLAARASHLFVDRVDGAVYENQWNAAITTAADWVVITTWNEWWENTEIEPGVKYGTYYLDRTREWSARFKGPRH
jgi:hypothetical protein